MKARALAATLDGRVAGAGDVEISRAVHPTEATCEGDIAIAMSPDTIRILVKATRRSRSFQRGRKSQIGAFRR